MVEGIHFCRHFVTTTKILTFFRRLELFAKMQQQQVLIRLLVIILSIVDHYSKAQYLSDA